MKHTDYELMEKRVGKLYTLFLLVLSVLSLLEFVLILRGLILFDLTRVKHCLYLCSYIFLFAASLASFVVMMVCRNKPARMKYAVNQSYIYAFCLLVWATLVSTIDTIAGGDSMTMVFVMTSMAVGTMILMKPIYFVCALVFCGSALIACNLFLREEPLSVGFYINFMIFLVLAVFLNVHNYHLSKREFMATRNLEKLSYTDQLTNAYNRRRLDEDVLFLEKSQQIYTFVLIDIDNFKAVNDTFGHPVGDRCITMVSQSLQEQFEDGVYRFGGDEFAIVTALDAAETGARLDKVNKALRHAQADIDLHISAGIYQTAISDPSHEVFIRTDKALYAAKQAGKAQWALYER